MVFVLERSESDVFIFCFVFFFLALFQRSPAPGFLPAFCASHLAPVLSVNALELPCSSPQPSGVFSA